MATVFHTHRIGFPLRPDQIVNATDLTDSLMVHVDAVVVCIDSVWEQNGFSKLSENTAQALANDYVPSPADQDSSRREMALKILRGFVHSSDIHVLNFLSGDGTGALNSAERDRARWKIWALLVQVETIPCPYDTSEVL
jgi:hypothetical protein